jgi:hypothetical protein
LPRAEPFEGLPVFPGAQVVEDLSWSKGGQHNFVFNSGESVEKIAEFYELKLNATGTETRLSNRLEVDLRHPMPDGRQLVVKVKEVPESLRSPLLPGPTTVVLSLAPGGAAATLEQAR